MRPARIVAAAVLLSMVVLAVVGCTAPSGGPSTGSYTVAFPSTAAAVATDTVQLLVFEVPKAPDERAVFCQSLVQARNRKDPQVPLLQNAPVNICEMLGGRKPITIPYGEKAVLAVAQRKGIDFMSGCVIQTFGNGDAPLDIDLALIDVSNPVPDTTCASVGEFCSGRCPAL